jgi:membrane protease YdiL (CAAX protease family)
MKKKEKKYIAPNEASLGRWIGALVVGTLIGFAIAFVVALIFSGRIDNILGIELSRITLMLNFTPMFIGLVIAIKLVGKTSLKDFILGVGGKLNRKECLIVLVLSLISFFMGLLTELGHIHMSGISFGTFAASVLIMLAVIWMQTTYEELIFRGIFLRWIAKNDIGFNKKSILAAVVSSVLFALSHITNVEVTSLHGLEQIAMVCAYAIPGMAFFLMSMYFGNLMPGIIMHWVNNFMLATLISGEVATIAMPTLLVTTTEHNGYMVLLSTLMTKIPFVAYILWDIRKKKKAAAAN